MSFQNFDNLTVGFVDKSVARDMIEKNHYSKKWATPFGIENVGVYRDGELLGVAAYGYPMNPKSWASISDIDPSKCLELNRLWIHDTLGKNTETWLLAKSFDLLREKGYRLIQSFSDGRLGVGTIYQAANFSYHGFHVTLFHEDIETGVVYHDTAFHDTRSAAGMIARNMLFATGRTRSFKVNTYRYLKPLDKGARRAIKLAEKPYPKERVGRIDFPDFKPSPSQIARVYALADAAHDYESARIFREYLDTLTDDPMRYIEAQQENKWVIAAREKNSDQLLFV